MLLLQLVLLIQVVVVAAVITVVVVLLVVAAAAEVLIVVFDEYIADVDSAVNCCFNCFIHLLDICISALPWRLFVQFYTYLWLSFITGQTTPSYDYDILCFMYVGVLLSIIDINY